MVDWKQIWDLAGSATISLTDHAKGVATTALWVIVTIALLLIVLKIVINWIKTGGKRESLNFEQKEWLRIGGYNVRKMKLKHLFGSVSGKKLTDLGTIVTYIDIENKRDQDGETITDRWALIGVKSSETRFYYMDRGTIQNRGGDMIVSDWNFSLDKSGRYYVQNQNSVIKSIDDEDSELKTLQALSKYTLDAIKSNPIHKTRLRERNLANASQETNWSMGGN